jgi:uncharacterized repeat protein (TIGR03803 family)
MKRQGMREFNSLFIVLAMLALASGAWAQSTYKSLYRFTGGADGNAPWAGLTVDSLGNLYGATLAGGNLSSNCAYRGCGVIFKLAPKGDGTWSQSVLYTFCSATDCADGSNPAGTLVFDRAGNLYGTTEAGGNASSCIYRDEQGCGVVFKLAPNGNGTWTESVLYNFCSITGCPDGLDGIGSLVFDKAGNLYGTSGGGLSKLCVDGCGVVFKLSPNADGSWAESVLYSFKGGADGWEPQSGLILDDAGNLYGMTLSGGYSRNCGSGCGIVFEISPSGKEKVLHRFNGNDGGYPSASLTFDQSGNLYGATEGGSNFSQCGGIGCGVAFELIANAGGSWKEKILHRFNGSAGGGVPTGKLIFDTVGNLYGTTTQGGNFTYCNIGCGVVFKLAPNAEGGWKETVLRRFADHPGTHPVAGLTSDAAGNLFGTTIGNYSTTFGSVFEITP